MKKFFAGWVIDGSDRHAHALVYKKNHLDPRATPIKVFTAGRAWRMAGRYGKLIGRSPGAGNSLASAIEGSREKKDHVKIVNSGLNNLVQFGRNKQLHSGKEALHPVEGARRNLEHQLEQMAMARQLGVLVAVGTDAGSPGVDHGRSFNEEIGLLIRAGYSIPEAVVSATRINARVIGLKGAGCLASVAPATFVIIEGPPEGIPHRLKNIKSLVIDGKQFA